MQVNRSNVLTTVPFENGFDLYAQLCLCISEQLAGIVIGQLIDYSHPDFARHMQAVGHLAVREDINPRNTPQQQQNSSTIEGLVVAIGTELHRTFSELRMFVTDDGSGHRSFPYELFAVKNDTLVLNRLIYS